MLKTIVFPAPDKKRRAILVPLGEIHRDDRYYSLSIDGLPDRFLDRVFGRAGLWSPESRFLAVQEWKKADEAGSAVQ